MRSTFSKLLLISVFAVSIFTIPDLENTGIHSLPVRLQQKPKKVQTKLAGVARAHFEQLIEEDIYPDRNNVYFMATLPLGDDKIMSELIIDSGSSVMWIPKEECGPNHDSGLARDCDVAETTVSLFYLDGDIHGRRGNTSIWMNHGQNKSVGHQFIVVEMHSEYMENGILGLAKGTDDSYKTFLQTLKDNGLIKDTAFSVFKNNDKLELIIGGINLDKLPGNKIFAEAPIKSPDSFKFDLDFVKLGHLS